MRKDSSRRSSICTVMGKIENRGFMFRLDFSNFLSSMAQYIDVDHHEKVIHQRQSCES